MKDKWKKCPILGIYFALSQCLNFLSSTDIPPAKLLPEVPPLSRPPELPKLSLASIGWDGWFSWKKFAELWTSFLTELFRISLFNSLKMIMMVTLYRIVYTYKLCHRWHIRICIQFILISAFHELSLSMFQRMENFLLLTVQVVLAISELPESHFSSPLSWFQIQRIWNQFH